MPLTLANKITIIRILAVPFFITAVLYYSPQDDHLRYVALVIFLFAVVSDVIDGYIARVYGQKTSLGMILDPLADKILLVSSFVCLYQVGQKFPVMNFPAWLIVGVISRDVMLMVGATLIFMFKGRIGVEVTVWGKAATFFQVASVIGLLLQWSWTQVFWYAAFALTMISGVVYFRRGYRLLNTIMD